MTQHFSRLRGALLPAGGIAAAAVALPIALTASAGSTHNSSSLPLALPGYHVSVFARGTDGRSNPNSLVVWDDRVFVGFQNVTAKDGLDGKSSTVVEYRLDGDIVRTFSVPGHNDGLRMNPASHRLWALSNEDGNPRLTTIDPETGDEDFFSFAPTAHGGGFDDVQFLDGHAYITASNPTLNSSGQNTAPALDEATLSGTTVSVTPVLMGNASALDLISKQTVTLNEIDPDSLYVTPSGDLQMDNQGGSELVFIHAPGTAGQTVSRLGIGNQMDDSIFARSHEGRLLVADTPANAVYWISSDDFSTTLYYSAAPQDSGVAGFVGTVDPATGTVTPVVIGMKGPHGEAWVGNDEGDR